MSACCHHWFADTHNPPGHDSRRWRRWNATRGGYRNDRRCEESRSNHASLKMRGVMPCPTLAWHPFRHDSAGIRNFLEINTSSATVEKATNRMVPSAEPYVHFRGFILETAMTPSARFVIPAMLLVLCGLAAHGFKPRFRSARTAPPGPPSIMTAPSASTAALWENSTPTAPFARTAARSGKSTRMEPSARALGHRPDRSRRNPAKERQRVRAIESGGTIRKSGSAWGSATNCGEHDGNVPSRRCWCSLAITSNMQDYATHEEGRMELTPIQPHECSNQERRPGRSLATYFRESGIFGKSWRWTSPDRSESQSNANP